MEDLREWVIQETEFQTKATETIQENMIRGVIQEKYLTFLVSKIRVLDQSHQQNIEFVSYATSHLESGLVVSLKQWKYPKEGSTLKKSKLCFRCLGEGHSGQSCFRMRVYGLDGCTEVHHRLLHKQAVNKNKTGNKIQVMQQIYIINKQVVMLIMVYHNSKTCV